MDVGRNAQACWAYRPFPELKFLGLKWLFMYMKNKPPLGKSSTLAAKHKNANLQSDTVLPVIKTRLFS